MANPLLITNTDISGVLKNVYTKYRTEAFPILTPVLAQVRKLKPGMANAKFGGNGVYFDVSLTRPTGFVNSDAGFLPTSSQTIERQGNIGIRRSYVRRQIDALAIQATVASEAAFIPLARKVMNEAVAAAKLGQQENLHGDGRGVKAVVSTPNTTTNFQVSSPYGLASSGQGGLLLDVGMYIAVLDSAGGTVRGRATVTALTNAGDVATVTIDSPISGIIATDIIVAATASDTNFNQGTNGLINITNRGGSFASLHGITQASFPRWDATRMVAGTDTPDASQPTEMDIWQLCTLVANRSGQDPMASPDEFLLVTTPGVYRRLGESFLGQRRYEMGPAKTLQGGFKAIEVAGLPLVQDYWCPAGTLYLLHIPSLMWVDLQDFQPLSYEGVGPWRFIADRDAYEYNFGAYWNIGTIARNAHGSITGYVDSVRYSHVV